MIDTTIPEVYKSDHLFLLVGTNPLPNYVAVQLMAADDATLYLLHSKTTFDIAQRLKASIEAARSSFQVIPREINETDGQKIERQIQAILDGILPKPPPNKVGLNYTGGTKPMAVHTYRVIKQAFPQGIFSYLDAGSLRMFIAKEDEPTQSPFVGQELTLELDKLLELHGYKLSKTRREPEHPEFFLALAQIHSNPDGFHEWKGSWDVRKQSKGWLKTDRPLTTLPTREEYPHLEPIIGLFEENGGDPDQIARQLGLATLDNCYKWFDGIWLEEYTLHALKKFADELGMKHYGINLNLHRSGARDFELDIAAMYGYQLFAISCIATEVAGKAKEHLMEAFVRARQLGGDEARYGVVSCVQNPAALQREIEQQWDAEGKVWVFGMYDLPYLAEQVKLWFTPANKERR